MARKPKAKPAPRRRAGTQKKKSHPKPSDIREAEAIPVSTLPPEKPEDTPRKRGRESTLTQAIGDAICTLIGEGYCLIDICELDEMPAYRTIMLWLYRGEREKGSIYEDFMLNYARAREIQGHTFVEKMLKMPDDIAMFWLRDTEGNIMVNKFGRPIPDPNYPARLRAKMEAFKWAAGKMNPKVYGERHRIDLNTKKNFDPDNIDASTREILEAAGLKLED